jgi:hypothetical protein
MEIFVSSSTTNNKFCNCFTTISEQLLTTVPLLLTLFGSLFAHYFISQYPNEEVGEVGRLYSLYQDVHVMIFVGFGFLMT